MTQNPPTLLIVSGPPGVGKTSLARRLATDLSLPLLYKDGIKELLFDHLGTGDVEWSRRLGRATYDLLFYILDLQLSAGCATIVESNFDPKFANANFRRLLSRHPAWPIQVQCSCDGNELVRRFSERQQSGERHPGHQDLAQLEELRPVLLKGRYEPLDIGGALIEVDMTDLDAIDYAALLSSIQNSMPTSASSAATR